MPQPLQPLPWWLERRHQRDSARWERPGGRMGTVLDHVGMPYA